MVRARERDGGRSRDGGTVGGRQYAQGWGRRVVRPDWARRSATGCVLGHWMWTLMRSGWTSCRECPCILFKRARGRRWVDGSAWSVGGGPARAFCARDTKRRAQSTGFSRSTASYECACGTVRKRPNGKAASGGRGRRRAGAGGRDLDSAGAIVLVCAAAEGWEA